MTTPMVSIFVESLCNFTLPISIQRQRHRVLVAGETRWICAKPLE